MPLKSPISKPICAPQQNNIALVVAIGLDLTLDWADDRLRIIELKSKQEVLDLLTTENVSTAVFGPGIAPDCVYEILLRYQAEHPTSCTSNIVLGCGSKISTFQLFVDQDWVFYLTRGSMPKPELRSIIAAGVKQFQERERVKCHGSDLLAAPPDCFVDTCTRLLFQTDLLTTCDVLVESVQAYAHSDIVRCLIYDLNRQVLCQPDTVDEDTDADDSPCAGVVGYLARTGEEACVERLESDSRYDSEADNPTGVVHPQLLGVPIFGNGGNVIGVVALIRNGESAHFDQQDIRIVRLLTTCAAPALCGILMQRRIRALVVDRIQSTVHQYEVYRREALQSYAAQYDREGELLHSLPAWMKRTHWVIIALLLTCIAFTTVIKIHKYATGPAVVRARSKLTVRADRGGMISSVLVSQGDRVRIGDLLVQFYQPGATQFGSVKEEARVPKNGLVSEVWVHEGELIKAGGQIASIIDESSGYDVEAFLPGYYAPELQPGMKLVLKLNGYPRSADISVVRNIGAEIISPSHAAQYSLNANTDSDIGVAGPVITVRSTLSRSTFEQDGFEYRLFDGMTGQVQVTLGSTPLIFNLVPGLKNLKIKAND